MFQQLAPALLALVPLAAQQPFRSYADRSLPLPIGVIPVTATAVDLDGDAAPEVVAHGIGVPNALFVFRNDGTGRFTEDVAGRRNLATGAVQLLAGDFDGDGAADVLLTFSGGLWRNDGAGNLEFGGNRTPPGVASNGRGAAADLDGDGDLDVVLPRQAEPNVLLLNDGSGRFVDASSRLTPDNQITEVAVTADVDGDGDQDLLFGSWPSSRPGQGPIGRIKLHLNDGAGQFTDVSASQLPDVEVYVVDLVAVDLNGDGAVDIAVTNALGPPSLLINDGQGRFTDRSADLPALGTAAGAHLASLDFDRDGDRDLLLSTGAAQILLVNDGAAGFSPLSPSLLPAPTLGANRVVVTDLDRDGDDDVLLPRSSIVGNAAAGLWFGQYRQVDAAEEPAIGRDWVLQIGHRAGAAPGFGTAIPLVAPSIGNTRIAPLGILGLDPSTTVALQPLALSGAAGHTGWTIPVPDDRTLVGTAVAVQALILQPLEVARFTNVWRATFREE